MTDTGLAARSIKRASRIAEQLAHRARDGRDGELVEVAPDDHLIQRLDFLARQLDTIAARQAELAARLEDVEARPHVSEDTVRQLNDGLNAKFQAIIEKLVNRALGDVRARLVTVEKTVDRVPAQTNGEPQSAQLTRLADVVRSLGEYVGIVQKEFNDQHDALERQYAEMSEHMRTVNEHVADVNADVLKTKTILYRALKAFEGDEGKKGAA